MLIRRYEIVKDQKDQLEKLRHSCSHVMAQAVQELFPGTKVAIGPTIEDGFYYDFDSPHRFVIEDFESIEKRMKEIASKNLPFVRSEKSRDEAVEFFANKGENYKIVLAQAIPAGESITFYQHDSFIDLCRGPHLESTGPIKHFKLLNVSGAYWRGDEKNPMLQRIYGTAWFIKDDLDNYLKRLEEAKKRDHRKLGVELDLFSLHEEIGGGLVLWHPKGALVRYLIEEFWRREHLKYGYELVFSPHIARQDLWSVSGHLEWYQEYLYNPMDIDGQKYLIKPMNCPFHITMYNSRLRSYRDLPMRWAELGTVYRYERSGVLHGLLRVRGFTQDDAHLFIRHDQLNEEVERTIRFCLHILRSFGFESFNTYLATRPEKFVGEISAWNEAEAALKRGLEAVGLKYETDAGGGAFYGPKIDLKLVDALGREWQCSTIQVDFQLPERFKLEYVAQDGSRVRPCMIHRALLGSIERFFAVLVEHYAGAFPLWLAPVQVKFINIKEETAAYCEKAAEKLRGESFRVEVDKSKETLNAKIRNATMEKVPVLAIVGKKEQDEESVTLRARNGTNLGMVKLADLAIFLRKM
ncbi:MAG: threonine--tRNA ligase, partial [Elusimicrobia bacterium]|nr:threonine--tRNA ligase [Elusimicrobiota bacterium]